MNDALDPILQQESQRRLKVQLAWRLGIAATLIVLVLFGINWLDQQKEAPPSVLTPIPLIAPPVTEAEPLPLPTSAPIASAAIEASSALSVHAPIASSSASGVIEGASRRPTPTPPSLTPRPSISKPTLKLEAINPAVSSTQKPAPESAVIATKPEPITRPASVTQAPQSTPVAAPLPYPAAQHTPNGYTVQAGVFMRAQNADKLLSQLKAAGIPAFAETRVQIGPFKDKASADAAAAKLKRMGIDPIVRGN
ncbi:MAG: SPOR domain-containing protein [Burkholderiales bacterium]|nr:SPOR domain-containing protein [Burkholderiales bacterium]